MVKVKDRPNLVKVDNSYVINIDVNQYNAAITRKRTDKRMNNLEEKVFEIEENIAKILSILEGSSIFQPELKDR